MKIFIGADLVPTEQNYHLFNEGDTLSLVGDKVLEKMNECDYRVFNLELALCDKPTPIIKGGPNIGAPTSTIKGIKGMNPSVLAIANNHVLDHGYEGFVSTIDTLNGANIPHVGGGFSIAEAKAPYYFERDGIKVGVYACCEHEFSWIDDYGFGANGFDALETPDEIAEIKKTCDYLIVLYHGGKEHYRYPSPRLMKVCRKIAEKGADIVLCQHTHCGGAMEDWQGSKIISGQGNFVFVRNYGHIPTWGEGFAVIMDIQKDGITYDYVPYDKTEVGIAYDESGEIIKGLNERSEEIKLPKLIESKFEQMAKDTVVERYVQNMLGYKPSEEELKQKLICLFHYAECEVHHECLLTGLRALGGLGRYGEFEKKE